MEQRTHVKRIKYQTSKKLKSQLVPLLGLGSCLFFVTFHFDNLILTWYFVLSAHAFQNVFVVAFGNHIKYVCIIVK